MLGIIIGIGSVILLISIGKGAESLILNELQGFGSKNIVVAPGRQPEGPSQAAEIFTDSLKERDVELLSNKSNVPYAQYIVPVVGGPVTISYEGTDVRTMFHGFTKDISYILDMYVVETGRMFSEEDVKGHDKVVILGQKIRDELFGESDPIGQIVKLKKNNFRVIGVFQKMGVVGFEDQDDGIYIPTTTGQDIMGIKYYQGIMISVPEERYLEETKEDIAKTLRISHNIEDPANDDFHLVTQDDIAEKVNTVTGVLTILLSSIAVISLVVGGIGIMNIMLVSVTERTKEIGLRKAVGAKNADILRQFLFEALLLTVFGGMMGVAMGASLSGLVALVMQNILHYNWSLVIPLNIVFWAVFVSSVVGLVFGIYPARKAAQLDPVEALRYE
jgi:putative ABC transport system permease protein